MNDEQKSLDSWGPLKYFWMIALSCMVLIALSLGVYLYQGHEQRRLDLENAQKGLAEQHAVIDALQADMQSLKQQVVEHKVVLASHKELADKTTEGFLKMKSGLAASFEATAIVKKEMQDWQKDYLAVLLKVEQKADGGIEHLKAIDVAIQEIDAAIDDIDNQISSLQARTSAVGQPLETSRLPLGQ